MSSIALVTGANKGLGHEIARQLARTGVHVIVSARDAKKAQTAADGLIAEGLTAEALRLDVTDPAGIAAAVRQVDLRHGRLDKLINNAGIMVEQGQTPATLSLVAVRSTFETNLFGVMAVTQAFLPLLRRSLAGRIVNLSSILGSLAVASDPASGIPRDFRFVGYATSKTALNMYTALLAGELADTPIKVNAAHPGWVRTDLGGPEAPLDVETGARTAVNLAILGSDGPTGGFFHLGQRMPW